MKLNEDLKRFSKVIMTPPGFEFHMLKSHGQESVMRCDFINGYKRVYYLGMTPFSIIMEDIKLLNEAIEL